MNNKLQQNSILLNNLLIIESINPIILKIMINV